MIDARKFNTDIVEPTLAEFNAEYSCLRRAYLAVAVVDALAAQIYNQTKKPFDLLGWHIKGDPENPSDSYFRHRIAENCEGFKIILDVAKANKHAILTQIKPVKPVVTRSDQTEIKSIGYGSLPFGEGRYGGVEQVIVRLDSGKEVYLETQIHIAHKTLLELVDLLDQPLEQVFEQCLFQSTRTPC